MNHKAVKNLITLIVISCSSIILATEATEYKSHRSMVLTTIPMKYELALKVIPVIRTSISEHGHIAHVKGADQLVISAKPETIRVLENIFSSLTIENFNQKTLRIDVKKELSHNQSLEMKSQIVDLNNLKLNVVIRALRSLVSKEGNLSVMSNGIQIKVQDYPIYLKDIVKLIKKLDS